jgi:tetratricopeptide (TPR) repeat protein
LAQIFYDQGKYTDALPYYSKLEKIATTQNNFVVALLGQMRCNYTLGNYEAAKNNATAILPVNTEIYNQIEANFILGQIQHNAKNYYSAMIHFNYVVENSQTEKGAQAEYLRCLIMYQQGNLADSKEEIFVLGDQYASYEYWVVKSFILLGYIYTDEEDFFSARATLQTTLDLYDKDQALIDEINAQLKKIDALEQAKKKGIKP